MDVNKHVLREARQRVSREVSGGNVNLILADAHSLPFKTGTFDVVMAESVLVFCDKDKVAGEAFRVLGYDGPFGDNEMTLRKPDEDMKRFLGSLAGAQVLSEDDWKAVYERTGFRIVRSGVFPIRMTEQLHSHIAVDGPVKYLRGMAKGLLNPAIMAPFLRWDVLKMAFRYRSTLCYGLYVSRKP